MHLIRLTSILVLPFLVSVVAHAKDTEFVLRPAFVKEISMWPADARANVENICTTPKAIPKPASPAAEIHAFLAEITKDPVGQKLVQKLIEADPIICQYAGFGQRGYFDSEVNLIGVEQDLSVNQKLLILIHEARHLDQHTKGFERTLDYSLDEYVRFTFMLEADAQAIATLVAWNLKERGYPRAWHGLMSLDHYQQTGRAFEGVYYGIIDRGNTTNNKALATASAFRAWTDNLWLTGIYRAGAKNMFWDELEETKKIQKYDHAPLSFYSRLCTDEGFIYPCLRVAPPAEGLSKDR